MASDFQDDEREEKTRELFSMYKDDNEGRSGIDAHLSLEGVDIPFELDTVELPFELKTTSNGSVTTVRDFGPDHIEKWKNKHWLIGFFIDGEEYYKYLSPKDMAPWIKEKADYISLDFGLAEILSKKLTLTDMYKLIGRKSKYTLDDAKKVQKKQHKVAEYKAMQDKKDGYSPRKMLEILNNRTKYLIERGSTLNNPHIPLSYFESFPKITENHSEDLLTKVKEYLTEQHEDSVK